MAEAEYDIPFGRPLLGAEELSAVERALQTPQLVHGPVVRAFERDFSAFLGPEACATAVSSCTAGLHLSYMHLGIGHGDEVVVPALTHVASAHAVSASGARPVFVDSDKSGNISIDKLEAAISPRTRAICVVHYPGLPVDMPAVMAIADRHSLAVVEDCALALGASLDGTPCGLFGDVASFSFYPAKHMTTGEGGMVVSRQASTVESIASLKAFGYDRGPEQRSIPGKYDIARLGVNYRLSEIAASIGIEQLKKLPRFLLHRRRNMEALRGDLRTLERVTLLPDSDARRKHSNYCLVAVLDDLDEQGRDRVLLELKKQGIGASIYYPVALPASSYYRDQQPTPLAEFPNAVRIASRSLALPVGPHLDEGDMDIIATTLRSVLARESSSA